MGMPGQYSVLGISGMVIVATTPLFRAAKVIE
jgi:hypothetical protein